MSISPASGDKIQVDDNWFYTDNEDNPYNETALAIVQLQSGDDFVAAAEVYTDRPFIHDYRGTKHLDGDILEFIVGYDLAFGDGNMFLTQEAGIPLYVTRDLGGPITITATSDFSQHGLGTIQKTLSYDLDVINWDLSETSWEVSGNPALALSTATSFAYTVTMDKWGADTNGTGEEAEVLDSFQYTYSREYLISTNNDLEDPIKDYTFTKLVTIFDVRLDDGDDMLSITFTQNHGSSNTAYICHEIDSGSYGVCDEVTLGGALSLNQAADEAMLITVDDDYAIPTFIRQAEPAPIMSALGLSQSDDEIFVEYTLDIETDDPDDNGGSEGFLGVGLYFIPAMVTLVIVKKYRGKFS